MKANVAALHVERGDILFVSLPGLDREETADFAMKLREYARMAANYPVPVYIVPDNFDVVRIPKAELRRILVEIEDEKDGRDD